MTYAVSCGTSDYLTPPSTCTHAQVPLEKARQMCIIQPGLLTETERNAEVLASGLKLICYDLKAPREEIIELIINNPSILHGRELRLSVADMANLAMMREPKGRIVS